VYVDKTKNSTKEATDLPIAGTTVTLYDSNNNPVATTTTDATGYYEFKNLLPGSYVVKETQPVQYGSSENATNSIPVNLVDKDLINLNFGEIYSSISGNVYYDKNNDGIKDTTDLPIAATTITLTGSDVLGNPVNLTTTTDATGYYEFKDLLAGSYTITETQPSNYNDGKDTLGTNAGTLNQDKFTSIVLPGGVDSKNYNFGEIGTKLSGKVFLDLNKDANINGSDTTMPVSIKVNLYDSTNTLVESTMSDTAGNFEFTNLLPGTYTVEEVAPSGYTTTTPTRRTVTIDILGSSDTVFGHYTTPPATPSLSGTGQDMRVVVELASLTIIVLAISISKKKHNSKEI
jgi:protocatechuate 3,4-dioxygenase beta subunit